MWHEVAYALYGIRAATVAAEASRRAFCPADALPTSQSSSPAPHHPSDEAPLTPSSSRRFTLCCLALSHLLIPADSACSLLVHPLLPIATLRLLSTYHPSSTCEPSFRITLLLSNDLSQLRWSFDYNVLESFH